MNVNTVDDEDEDIIIQGTPLYEHLHRLGYTDFESVTIAKSVLKNKEINSRFIGFIQYIKNAFKKLFVIYSKTNQDDSVSKKQVSTILDAKVLLNDHACIIHRFRDKYNCKPWRSIVSKFLLSGVILSSSIYIPYTSGYKNSMRLFVLFMVLHAGYIEWTRVGAHKNLKTVISLQNDLFLLCKKGLKILKYGYKVKLRKDQCSQQFYGLTVDRLKYLQPIMENVVACLEHVSLTYYCICSILIKLLPINMSHKDLLTEFKTESFKICGEINYQKLKTLYHIYILVQSEMLHLLATSYDSHTWQESCNKIPEFKLAYIVDFLNKYLTIRKGRLSNIIHAYYSFKVEPISYTHKESTSSHWQDLYMHLYLASNRLQVAHGHILSVLQNIDDNTTENTENKTVVEDTLQKLNQAQKDLENAKDFIEFSSLYLLKTQIHDHTENHSEMNMLAPIIDGDIPIVHDSEPLIMDEVFEEYIKEEYLKPLIEESDEIPLYNYKRDKSLFKNFMIELKDVLVDKQRSMSERELKALHRMHKSVISETALENKFQIPRPPSMPSLGTFYTLEEEQIAADKDCNNTIKEQLNYSTEESKIITRTFECEQDEKGDDHFLEHKSPISFIPLPRNKEFTTFLPPLFLKTGEETFTGSGENSEDEVIDIQ